MLACTKVSQTYESGKNDSEEILLSTLASPSTKSIIEDSSIPVDNVIQMQPHFYADNGSDYGDGEVWSFMNQDGLWRGALIENNGWFRGIYDPFFGEDFMVRSNPLYWPSEDRIKLDFIAYSTNVRNMDSVKDGSKETNQLDIDYSDGLSSNLDEEENYPSVNLLRKMFRFLEMRGRLEEIQNEYLENLPVDTFLVKLGNAYEKIANESIIPIEPEPEVLDSASVEPAKPVIEEPTEYLQYNREINTAYYLYMKYYPEYCKYLQDDLLYSFGRNISKDNGVIGANFKHAKAWVKIIVKNYTDHNIMFNGAFFVNTHANGSLHLDNSKQLPDAYWTFNEEDPGVIWTVDTLVRKRKAKEEMNEAGMCRITERFFVPAHCVGPFKPESLNLVQDEMADDSSRVCSYINCEYYDIDKDGDEYLKELPFALSGSLFPAQEPGILRINYQVAERKVVSREYPKDKVYNGKSRGDGIDMTEAFRVQYYQPNTLMSINLPRHTWQMGRQYIYVISITDNEVTVSPYTEPWDDEKEVIISEPDVIKK